MPREISSRSSTVNAFDRRDFDPHKVGAVGHPEVISRGGGIAKPPAQRLNRADGQLAGTVPQQLNQLIAGGGKLQLARETRQHEEAIDFSSSRVVGVTGQPGPGGLVL
jgi:hypothetical protein